MAESSSVGPEVVRKIAALARLRVPDAELSAWSRQLSRIVSYIDQLKDLPEEALRAGPVEATPLREDSPFPGGGLKALEANAPALLHGHGVVPRVLGGSLGDTESAPQTARPASGNRASKSRSKDGDAR
ncbi:MAG TPA: Asp-tRNA(Asn)/Glu-tRNA(Gln) amidotransferase subunit GatC [Thermoanaerobaculia bacterium]|nr:Asp-tRNA(Asn)/Glu-tRNA(Gln) amidotransferase subunit GatC [Thermoanaerobaculia bacterium]